MNLGIDFHDTLSYAPEFFRQLVKGWPGKVYIVTGTPASKRKETEEGLRTIGFEGLYEDILMGYEYQKEDMTVDHFRRMREHKLNLLHKYNITVYFDDNPFYVHWMKEHGIIAFLPCVSPEYLSKFAKGDLFFSCHLQEKMFAFLDTLSDVEVLKQNDPK